MFKGFKVTVPSEGMSVQIELVDERRLDDLFTAGVKILSFGQTETRLADDGFREVLGKFYFSYRLKGDDRQYHMNLYFLLLTDDELERAQGLYERLLISTEGSNP